MSTDSARRTDRKDGENPELPRNGVCEEKTVGKEPEAELKG